MSQTRGNGWQKQVSEELHTRFQKAVGLLGHATNSLGNLNSNVLRILEL